MCTWRLLSVLKASSICPNSFEGIPLPSGVRASKGWRGKGPNFHEMHFCVILCHRLNLRKESWEWEVSFSCTLRNPSFWRALWIGQFSTPRETLWEFWSRQLIGWVLQDFQETCVLHSLTVLLKTKPLWRQTPSWKINPLQLWQWELWISQSMWSLRHGQ